MKFIKAINPKNLLQSKKSSNRRISKSEPVSFNTVSSSSSSSSSYSEAFYADSFKTRRSTPTSVLQPPERSRSQEIAPRKPVNGDGDVWLELVEAFKLIDRDGDGKITICELQTILSRIVAVPESEEELNIMLTEIDLDGDGCISLEEFGAVRSAFGPASGAEELRETFEVFDADHDGKITAEELLSVFSAIGDEKCTLEDCRRMIASVDVNGDGFVCFEEFKLMMEQQRISC